MGGAMTMPAISLERWAFSSIGGSGDVYSIVFLAFGIVALHEELLKFLVLRLYVFRGSFFNEPIDGIVYAVLIAMGFATMENFSYASRFGAQTILLRMFTAVPAHLVFAIVQGYFMGLAKFRQARRGHLMAMGLGLSVWMHGIYDFLIFQNWSDWLFVLATLSLYLCLFYSSKLIKAHLDDSPFR